MKIINHILYIILHYFILFYITLDFVIKFHYCTCDYNQGGHARIPLLQQQQSSQAPPNNNLPGQVALQPYMIYASLTCNHTDNLGTAAAAAAYSVYHSGNFPRRLHYSADATRIEPFLLTAKPGHWLGRNTGGATGCEKVVHGSDNRYPGMNGIFLAAGPSFRNATEVEPFSSVDLYNVMCHLTGLTPAENEGTTFGGLYQMLVAPPPMPVAGQPAATGAVPVSVRDRPVFPTTVAERQTRQRVEQCGDRCGTEVYMDQTEHEKKINFIFLTLFI